MLRNDIPPEVLNKEVDRIFGPLIAPADAAEKGKSVGLVVGITFGDPSQRFYFPYGSLPLHAQGGEPVAIQDLILFIGSNTKVFTATLLALAEIEGNTPLPAGLDTPVQDLLPARLTIDSSKGVIRLWHLATHSAGFPMPVCGQHAFGAYPFTALWDFIAKFQQPYPPGEYWVYSNPGFALLGVLLSRAFHGGDDADSYLHWPALVESELTRRMGLTDTVVHRPPETAHRIAQGYNLVKEGEPYHLQKPWIWDLTSAGLPAGALVSSARDMLTFLEAQMRGGSDTLARALDLTQRSFPISTAPSQSLSMGLGWQIANGYFDKNGALGGYESYMSFDREHRIGIVILGNSRGEGIDGAQGQAARQLLGWLRESPAGRSEFPKPANEPTCP